MYKSLKISAFTVLGMCLTILFSIPAVFAADETKTFAVLPFHINGPSQYQYLSQGIQTTMISRLGSDTRLKSIDKETVREKSGVASKTISLTADEGKKILDRLKVDYLVFGELTISDQSSSLNMKVVGRDGSSWPYARQTDLNGLIPALDGISKDVNSKIFKTQGPTTQSTQAKAPPSDTQKTRINRMNPDLVFNETTASQEFYLNPEFRYAGSVEQPGRWRSQSLPYAAVAMLAADVDGDKKTEIIVLGEKKVYAYRIENQRMQPLAEYEIPFSGQCLNLNAFDVNRDGVMEIIVSAIRDTTACASFMLNLQNNKLTVFSDGIDLFLNVVRIPPDFRPVLVGQGNQLTAGKLFFPGVYELIKAGNKFQQATRLPLPDKANALNFVYVPDSEGYKIIVADEYDKLRVYGQKNELMSTTDEIYAASATGVEWYDVVPGMGKPQDKNAMSYMYYVPTRLLSASVRNDNKLDFIVGHNVSVGAQFFGRFRTFPQGEVHSLAWDGVGLSLVWKTRRIKGSVLDYGIADIMNDGQKNLYVCVLSHPGMAGFEARRTNILAYTLDTSTTAGGKTPKPNE